jgi:hypothetical protein
MVLVLSLKLFASTIFCAWSMAFDVPTLRVVNVKAGFTSLLKVNSHPNDVLRPRLDSKHTENARTASDIQNSLVFEQVCIRHDLMARPDSVFQPSSIPIPITVNHPFSRPISMLKGSLNGVYESPWLKENERSDFRLDLTSL